MAWILTCYCCLIEVFFIPRSQTLCHPVNPSSTLHFEIGFVCILVVGDWLNSRGQCIVFYRALRMVDRWGFYDDVIVVLLIGG